MPTIISTPLPDKDIEAQIFLILLGAGDRRNNGVRRDLQFCCIHALTEGIHLHTLSCPDEAAFARVREALRSLGVLLEG